MSIIPPQEKQLFELNLKVKTTNERLEKIEQLLSQIVEMMSDEIVFRSSPQNRREN